MTGARLLSVLLVFSLFVPGGIGQLDLCACQGDEHGLFCDRTETPQPRAHSCCGKRADDAPSEGTQPPNPCPDCPRLDLGDGIGSKLPVTDEPCCGQLARITIEAQPTVPAPCDGRPQTPACWPRPPPGKHRLHLLHRVLLL